MKILIYKILFAVLLLAGFSAYIYYANNKIESLQAKNIQLKADVKAAVDANTQLLKDIALQKEISQNNSEALLNLTQANLENDKLRESQNNKINQLLKSPQYKGMDSCQKAVAFSSELYKLILTTGY
jgi:putative alpha-1,2-mannosidase